MYWFRSACLYLSAAISPDDLESAATALEPPPISAHAPSAGSNGIVHSYALCQESSPIGKRVKVNANANQTVDCHCGRGGRVAALCPGRYHRVPFAGRQCLRQSAAWDHGPYVEIALLDTTVAPGEYLSFGALFHGMPCQEHSDQSLCNYVDNFADGLDYEYEVLDSSYEPAIKCKFSGNNTISRTLSGRYRHWKTLGPASYRISSDCEPGSYKIQLTLMHSSCPNLNDYGQDACIDTESFQVSDSTSTGGGNQGGGNQGGGNQGGGNQGGGNQGGGNQGGGNQGGNQAATRAAATRPRLQRRRPQPRRPRLQRQRPQPRRRPLQQSTATAAIRAVTTQPRHRRQHRQHHSAVVQSSVTTRPRRQQRQLRLQKATTRATAATRAMAATTAATTKADSRVATTAAATRVTPRGMSASSHLSATRRQYHHRRNSSRRRPSPSPCPSY